VVESLHHHGFERFLIMNGHGGNIPAMGVAIGRIKEEIDPTFIGAGSYFHFMDSQIHKQHGATDYTGHACEAETARAMELIPEHVKYDSLAPGDMTDLTYEFGKTLKRFNVAVPYRFDQLTRNGALGDARIATPEYGKALVDSALHNLENFIDELIANSPVEG
jgi:creatinine amidohydrolase